MTLDEALNEVKTLIAAASPTASVTVARISDEEARVSVDAPAAEIDAIKDAVRERTIQLMVSEGLDVQVFVYDKDAPKGVVADS
jgi:hypothetical protein